MRQDPMCSSACPVPIIRLAHVGFNACDMDAMLRFYGDILGMRHLFTLTAGDRLGNDDPRKWIEYQKLADGQYIELFHHVENLDPEKTFVEDRWENYGYLKLNFEVADIQDLRCRLVAAEVALDEDIHKTVDGSLEIKVHDPDGNEVQFTQYTADSAIPLEAAPGHGTCSRVDHITQVAYQVLDGESMLRYYTQGLGLRHVFRLTYGDMAKAMEASGAPAQILERMAAVADKPWIDYIAVSPHQYLELFYVAEGEKKILRDLNDRYGYQHICFEVTDIQKAWEAVCSNGLQPDSPITLGCEGTYQFWLTDPDGNRMEIQQYTPKSMQLL